MSDALDEYLWELNGLHRRLREVVEGLASEMLDRTPSKDANSISVLVTHAVGAELGWLHLAAGREHKRDRASEFAVRQLEAADLLRVVDETERVAPELVRAAFEAGLETLRERTGARPLTVAYCLTHAAAHVAEHVGHAELTRQVLTSRG